MHLMNQIRREMAPNELETFFLGGSTNSFAIELYDFYRAIVDNRKPEVDALEGYKDMTIPLGFYESALLGRAVKVKDVEELRLEGCREEINENLGL